MKKSILILTKTLFITITVLAQTDNLVVAAQNYTNGKGNAASFGINIPVGEFSKTHFAGIALDYSWSHHRFGSLKALPKMLIGLTANGGIDYYFGKKETTAGYEYRYGGDIYFHLFAGAIYNPCKIGNITLTAGPTLALYKGIADAGLGINLGGSYSLTDKIAITPGITCLKHNDAASLWVVAVRGTYSF